MKKKNCRILEMKRFKNKKEIVALDREEKRENNKEEKIERENRS